MKFIKKKFLFPFFLIAFVIFTLFQFFFGENGYYNHKEKIKIISELKKENFQITKDITELNDKIKKLAAKDNLEIEKAMRSESYLYPGDTIIKVYHQSWLNEYARLLEKRFEKKQFEESKSSFFEKYKFLIGLFVSVILSFILSNLLFWKEKKPKDLDV